MENQNKPVRKYYPKKSIIPTERDMSIECFLDRVGWANYEQIQTSLKTEGYEISIPVLRTRMSFMVKFGRLRSTRSSESTYFALTKLSRRENELVGDLKHDRLPHENYIINLYLRLRVNMLLPREIRGQIKVGEKSGPIPDAIIVNNENDDLVHIEYERTAKSTVDVSRSIYNWLWSPRRHRSDSCVLVICASEQIFNKYQSCAEKFLSHNLKQYQNLKFLRSFEDGLSRQMKLAIIKSDTVDNKSEESLIKFINDVCAAEGVEVD